MTLSSPEFDLLVIGGGIVGAGVARDAALRGMRVALVDKRDFASGTSSRSTRLLHGGIRYLAQGRVGLVREASREKMILQKIAPHLTKPLPFIFPARKTSALPRWKLSIGVRIYDLLCGGRNLGRSETLSAAATLDRVPSYNAEGLTGAVRYYDGLTNDSRLVLDTLRSAAAAGAELANYVEFRGARREGGGWVSTLFDERAQAESKVHSRAVVNATGPWSDRIPGSSTSLRVTKGVHLVVDRARLPLEEAVVTAEASRILFSIPWGERTILGTTDTDYDGPLEEPRCDLADAEYVLEAINHDFPSAKLQLEDVISTWAGLRPLVADPNGDPSDISRRHEIAMREPNWWDVTGGKLTTYRLIGEQTVDAVVKQLTGDWGPCCSRHRPLLPAEDGDAVSSILPPPVTREVVEHSCRHEWALHLDDVMIRRTGWRYYHRNQFEIAESVVRWMADALGWNEEEIDSEQARYRDLVERTSPYVSPLPHTTCPAPLRTEPTR